MHFIEFSQKQGYHQLLCLAIANTNTQNTLNTGGECTVETKQCNNQERKEVSFVMPYFLDRKHNFGRIVQCSSVVTWTLFILRLSHVVSGLASFYSPLYCFAIPSENSLALF